ncbi:MAG: adenylate/guanylate cyclase domain-containing protein [Sandaracinaceae bacterium]|nr:adenylate/guanylate cyclase domain-containing protein [Sandaracinaceae bacterium]
MEQAQHPFSRAFRDRGVEAAYRAHAAREGRRHYRLAAVIGLGLWLSVALLDGRIGGSPENTRILLELRLFVAPVLIVSALLGWASEERFAKLWQVVMGAGIALVLWRLVLAGLLVDPSTYRAGEALLGYCVTVVAACALFPLRFPAAAIACAPPSLALCVVSLTRLHATTRSSVAWIVVSTLAALGASWLIERANRRVFLYGVELARERERSDKLLANLLPQAIAERLRISPGAIAESAASVTVLFADIVGFTPLAQKVAPAVLVETLDAIFTRFDEIVEEHGLEKIKTIGDAYMAVAGIPVERPDHAKAAAEAALAMRKWVEEREPLEGTHLSLRIGMHSGPVVAGVIGKKRLVYDLWGDTVNTASRMESHGVPGDIQVSQSVWEAIAQDYELEERGQVAIKGKGEMRTWILRGPRAR